MHSAEVRLSYRKRRVDGEWHRLIPSRFPPIALYERLGPTELGAVAADLESKTNPRLQSKARLLGQNADLTEVSPRLQNWNHAPFAYRNPEGSTFLAPAYGVLEVASGVRPALALALRRREVFLERTEEPPIAVEMRLLKNEVRGDFADLTDMPISNDQSERWAFGRELYEAGEEGVIFRRLEPPQIVVLAIFDNRVLGPGVQATHYRFVWDGKTICKIYDFNDGAEILREDLMDECSGRPVP